MISDPIRKYHKKVAAYLATTFSTFPVLSDKHVSLLRFHQFALSIQQIHFRKVLSNLQVPFHYL